MKISSLPRFNRVSIEFEVAHGQAAGTRATAIREEGSVEVRRELRSIPENGNAALFAPQSGRCNVFRCDREASQPA